MSDKSDKCESCGRQWIDHDGIIRTCKRNGDQAAEIAKLKAEIEALKLSDDTEGDT